MTYGVNNLDRYVSLVVDVIEPNLSNGLPELRVRQWIHGVDRVLRDELGVINIGIPRFYKIFFGRVEGLKTVSEAVFKKYIEGSNPLFNNK